MDSSHFIASLVFALATSVVFGVTSKNTDHDRFRYGAQVFGIFMAVLVGGAWFMFLLRR